MDGIGFQTRIQCYCQKEDTDFLRALSKYVPQFSSLFSTVQIFSLMFNLILLTPAHINLCSYMACTILCTLYLSLYCFDSLYMYNLWCPPKLYIHLGNELCLITIAPTASRTILGIQLVHTSTHSLDLLTSWVRYSHFIHFGHLQDWCWLLWFTQLFESPHQSWG